MAASIQISSRHAGLLFCSKVAISSFVMSFLRDEIFGDGVIGVEALGSRRPSAYHHCIYAPARPFTLETQSRAGHTSSIRMSGLCSPAAAQ